MRPPTTGSSSQTSQATGVCVVEVAQGQGTTVVRCIVKDVPFWLCLCSSLCMEVCVHAFLHYAAFK